MHSLWGHSESAVQAVSSSHSSRCVPQERAESADRALQAFKELLAACRCVILAAAGATIAAAAYAYSLLTCATPRPFEATVGTVCPYRLFRWAMPPSDACGGREERVCEPAAPPHVPARMPHLVGQLLAPQFGNTLFGSFLEGNSEQVVFSRNRHAHHTH
jgi:hypothetical protein